MKKVLLLALATLMPFPVLAQSTFPTGSMLSFSVAGMNMYSPQGWGSGIFFQSTNVVIANFGSTAYLGVTPSYTDVFVPYPLSQSVCAAQLQTVLQNTNLKATFSLTFNGSGHGYHQGNGQSASITIDSIHNCYINKAVYP